MSAVRARTVRRERVRVGGTVQGVGFRPYVFTLASSLDLGGFVRNDERGVLIEVEGDPEAVERFLARLPAEAPPLAIVEKVECVTVAPAGGRGFAILGSERGRAPDAPVAADTATCADCLSELLDPADRRFRYPFVNCTNCGPRFTIVQGVPYDRARTTMASFAMCERCRAEYEDPRDRRFHAEPIACPACGPVARFVGPDGLPAPAAGAVDAVQAAAFALRDGLIVAVKGIGGFHLAARAGDERAVAALRARKHREEKPFALMVRDLSEAGHLGELGERERALLLDPARPIVLARRRDGAGVAESVAPVSAELGLMLPYSPLHHLLLADAGGALVMTSGNVSDEPIAYEDGDAVARLAPIADSFLLHDRPIETRTDDSVVRAVSLGEHRGPLFIRRSRGYVPRCLDLPGNGPPVLACGAELKNTFCLAKGARAWVGHHVGDLENYETLRSFTDGIAHFERLFAVAPEVVAHDLHPDYLSTKYALDRDAERHVGVQHHHAHLAACLAEHGETATAIGAIYDGTGYGLDGTIWGGEILAGDLGGFERTGHLWPVRMPGGERAIWEPWRMACAWLAEANGTEPHLPRSLRGRVTAERWRQVATLSRSAELAPVTTSMGRLFDAVSALCGIRARVSHEGQAAVELEARADTAERGAYPLPSVGGVLDARETIRAIASDLERRVPVEAISARFHNGVVAATVTACAKAAAAHGTDRVVLSGGVFQNRLLLERTADALARIGLRTLVPERLPPNDGGISFGQAAVARTRLEVA